MRYRREEEHSRLDLVFTKRLHLKRGASYVSHLGKSDSRAMEMEVMGEREGNQGEKYKVNRRSYSEQI